MLVINISNAENLIFNDPHVRSLLPGMRHIFDPWLISQRVPFLRSLRLRSIMDLISNLDSSSISLLESYFKDSIVVDRLDYRVVQNIDASLEDVERELNRLESNFGNIAVSRDERGVQVTKWR